VTGLLTPADVRRLAAAHGITPTKKLGQNFVVDANTVRRIVALAGVSASDVVLEVGPGLGSLTLGLLETGAQVLAVEIDRALAGALPATAATHLPLHADRLAVLAADALQIRPGDLPASPTLVVANLPYNVSVPVLLHLLAEFPSLRGGLVMVQREVGERLAAPPGSRVYGVPSAKLGWFASAALAGPVPRSVFWPVPNVDSVLVALQRVQPPACDCTREQVFAVIDAAFSQRRKMLRSALASWAGSAARAESVVRAAGVDPSLRGEMLALADFVAICQASR
jgi:16S rRNA (adenine1518-N6/adenine1519-N6)-dimethyltransferase